MRLKTGPRRARISGVRTEIFAALVMVDQVYRRRGFEMEWTSGVESTHSPGSLHYVGLAVDIGITAVGESQRGPLAQEIKDTIGEDFDVVLRKDHIHIEFQPKEPMNDVV